MEDFFARESQIRTHPSAPHDANGRAASNADHASPRVPPRCPWNRDTGFVLDFDKMLASQIPIPPPSVSQESIALASDAQASEGLPLVVSAPLRASADSLGAVPESFPVGKRNTNAPFLVRVAASEGVRGATRADDMDPCPLKTTRSSHSSSGGSAVLAGVQSSSTDTKRTTPPDEVTRSSPLPLPPIALPPRKGTQSTLQHESDPSVRRIIVEYRYGAESTQISFSPRISAIFEPDAARA